MSNSSPHNPAGKKMAAFYDLLFCTADQLLWSDYSQFFKTKHPQLRVGYVPGADKLKPVLPRLAPDGLLLQDLRGEVPDDAVVWDRIKEKAVVIGLNDSEDLPERYQSGPWVRLDAVISSVQAVPDSWSRIQNIRNALKQPLMSLRIEDVAVSSIMQLLTMSERGSNVLIHGRKHAHSPWVDGRFYFQQGVLQFAATAQNVGEPAVFEVLGLKSGTIEVFSCFWRPERRNIRCLVDKLLLDFAVGYDESAQASEAAPAVEMPPPVDPAEARAKAREEDLAAALTAGTWGSSSHREIPERFQGASAFQVFRSLWSELPVHSIELLETSPEAHLSLDWMTPDKLISDLDQHPHQRVIALRGSLEFLICMLASWREEFHIDRFASGARPVIRVENDGADSLWFVGDLDEQPLEVLSDYPCAVWTEPQEADMTLRRTAARGHPAVILMTSDLKLYSLSLNWGLAYEGRVTVAHDCIIAQADTWAHVRRGLSNVLKVLTALAARCK